MLAYFIYNGIDSRKYEVYLQTLPNRVRPARSYIERIPLYADGSKITLQGFQPYDRTLDIVCGNPKYLDEIVAWLDGSGDIIFSDEPNRTYKVTFLNQIDYVKLTKFRVASITARFQPFKYSAQPKPIEVGGENVIIGGYSYQSDTGFFKNFMNKEISRDYAECILTSTTSVPLATLDISEGFKYKCREYTPQKKYTWSFYIKYTKWDINGDITDLSMGQRYTHSTVSPNAHGTHTDVTRIQLPRVGEEGCVVGQWVKVTKTIMIPDRAHSSVLEDQGHINFKVENGTANSSIEFYMSDVQLTEGKEYFNYRNMLNDVEVINGGNYTSRPKITLYGSIETPVSIYVNYIHACDISNIDEQITINSNEFETYKERTGEGGIVYRDNRNRRKTGDFPLLKVGKNTIKVIPKDRQKFDGEFKEDGSEIYGMKIEVNERWI